MVITARMRNSGTGCQNMFTLGRRRVMIAQGCRGGVALPLLRERGHLTKPITYLFISFDSKESDSAIVRQ